MKGQQTIPGGYLFAAVLIALAAQSWFGRAQDIPIDYSDFKTLVRAGRIQEARIAERSISGTIDPAAAQATLPEAVRKVLPREAGTGQLQIDIPRVCYGSRVRCSPPFTIRLSS